jgi:hypothetical protein
MYYFNEIFGSIIINGIKIGNLGTEFTEFWNLFFVIFPFFFKDSVIWYMIAEFRNEINGISPSRNEKKKEKKKKFPIC